MHGNCCAACGLLTVRDPHSMRFEEADLHFRLTGTWWSSTLDAKRIEIRLRPKCFRLRPELEKVLADNIDPAKAATVDGVKAAISTRHNCPDSIEWKQGYSPREHSDMMFDLESKKLAAEQVAKEREFRLAEKKADRKWNLSVQIGMAIGGALLGYLLRGGPPSPSADTERLIQALEKLGHAKDAKQ